MPSRLLSLSFSLMVPRYNPRKSVVENIQLPPTLLSRFDLIYLILDKPSSESDRRLAKHLVSLYYETPKLPPSGGLDHGLMRDYIAYARRFVHPGKRVYA